MHYTVSTLMESGRLKLVNEALVTHELKGREYGYHDLRAVTGIKTGEMVIFASHVSRDFPFPFQQAGLIFDAEVEPDGVHALDSTVLSDFVAKGRGGRALKKEIKEAFVLESLEKLKKKYKSHREVFEMRDILVSKYDIRKGDGYLHRVAQHKHTEIIFKEESLKIKPIGVFGFNGKVAKGLQKEFGVSAYRGIYDYIETL